MRHVRVANNLLVTGFNPVLDMMSMKKHVCFTQVAEPFGVGAPLCIAPMLSRAMLPWQQ